MRALVDRLVRTAAIPLSTGCRRSWRWVHAVRRLPPRIRIAVFDALQGRQLPEARVVLEERGVQLDLDTTDDLARRVLLGAYEAEELELLSSWLTPGDTCVDVGANIGLYTVAMASLVGPQGRVLAFEADPRNAEELKRNVALNRFDDRVQLHEVAVLDRSGTVEFNVREEGYSGHGSVHRYDGHVGSVVVPCVSLDIALRDAGVGDVALLKVDVEGADMDVYAGAEAALERRAFRRILAEWNGYWFPGLGWSVARFLEYFAAFGYEPAQPNLKGWTRLIEEPVDREEWVVNVLLERRKEAS